MPKTEKKLKSAVKRINKSKDQIQYELAQKEKVEKLKNMVRHVFPHLENQDSIYDAQTVVNALSGFIQALLEPEIAKIKLSQLDIKTHLDKEEDSKIKDAIIDIARLMSNESAEELAETLERLGQTLSQYSAHTFMKKPMSEVKL